METAAPKVLSRISGYILIQNQINQCINYKSSSITSWNVKWHKTEKTAKPIQAAVDVSHQVSGRYFKTLINLWEMPSVHLSRLFIAVTPEDSGLHTRELGDLPGAPFHSSPVVLNFPLSLLASAFGLLAVTLAFTALCQHLSSLCVRDAGDRPGQEWEIKLNGWSSGG